MTSTIQIVPVLSQTVIYHSSKWHLDIKFLTRPASLITIVELFLSFHQNLITVILFN